MYILLLFSKDFFLIITIIFLRIPVDIICNIIKQKYKTEIIEKMVLKYLCNYCVLRAMFYSHYSLDDICHFCVFLIFVGNLCIM